MTKKLTKEQEARIYCIKNRHANYVYKCWGYIHCGRCGTQIGDQLGSIFDTRNLLVIGCPDVKCKVCLPLIKKLSPMDLKIFNKVRKAEIRDYNKILKDIDIK